MENAGAVKNSRPAASLLSSHRLSDPSGTVQFRHGHARTNARTSGVPVSGRRTCRVANSSRGHRHGDGPTRMVTAPSSVPRHGHRVALGGIRRLTWPDHGSLHGRDRRAALGRAHVPGRDMRGHAAPPSLAVGALPAEGTALPPPLRTVAERSTVDNLGTGNFVPPAVAVSCVRTGGMGGGSRDDSAVHHPLCGQQPPSPEGGSALGHGRHRGTGGLALDLSGGVAGAPDGRNGVVGRPPGACIDRGRRRRTHP